MPLYKSIKHVIHFIEPFYCYESSLIVNYRHIFDTLTTKSTLQRDMLKIA